MTVIRVGCSGVPPGLCNWRCVPLVMRASGRGGSNRSLMYPLTCSPSMVKRGWILPPPGRLVLTSLLFPPHSTNDSWLSEPNEHAGLLLSLFSTTMNGARARGESYSNSMENRRGSVSGRFRSITPPSTSPKIVATADVFLPQSSR